VLAAFWAVSFLFVITPGVDWAYAISAGLRGQVTAAVTGMLCGHLAATMLVAAGVGGLVVRIPYALTMLTLVGACYLLWLGLGSLVKSSAPARSQDLDTGSWFSWAVRGLGVSGLNPKVILLFLALLPQFTNTSETWPIPFQIIVLGLVHSGSCAIVYLAVGYSAERVLNSRPAAAVMVSRISGASMIMIAGFLLAEHLV
jgi:threonine/homoserine/homoserine lactone efflux protein